MNKLLIIGLDISFSCTGITVMYLENNIGKKIQFYRVIFDDESNKKKQYVPVPISNVNQIVYRMPSNILVSDLVIDDENKNNQQQIETTLKAMIASKKIGKIIADALELYKPDSCIYCLENYVMPSYTGPTQLKSIGGLIMLQGFIREIIIRLGLGLKNSFKIMTPTPSNNKLFFCKNGSADKSMMLKAFIDNYDGKKLIPDASIEILGRINDVIDSFSLAMQAFAESIKETKTSQSNIIEL